MPKKRSGAPTSGTVAASGTDDSLVLPRIILFTRPVSPCIVTNHCTNSELLVKVNTELNGTVSETFVAPKLGQFVIPPKETKFTTPAATSAPEGGARHVDVSCGGLIAVHSVSFCTTHASDDLDDVSVDGFDG